MRFTLSDNFYFKDFEEGKLLINVETRDSYYIENDLYEILLPATLNFISFEELNYNDVYDNEAVKKFILSLIESKIFITT